ncbi:MAG: phosphoenolpyruvate synthase [Polyangiaceae bacterium]|nr:phosphoenolpyruvate synthase [Polyangiaceae bacterium]
MGRYTLRLQDTGRSEAALVGGKGAGLGELAKIPGIRVPHGFCITTEAFRSVLRGAPAIDTLLEDLSRLGADDRPGIAECSGAIRSAIEGAEVPDDIVRAIAAHIAELGDHHAYAVRSSATAEDLPSASFAGQQDTYLNVVGAPAILRHVRRCWASLFTARAVTYRLEHGFDHRKVHLAVMVQKMVFPRAAGVLFTADPVSFDRTVVSIDASFGLGEALVSGLVNPDNYKVRNGVLVGKTIATKQLEIVAERGGGTTHRAVPSEVRAEQALADAQVLELAQLGRTIEAHFGRPQDVEWCLAEGAFFFVQSRPITTLFPVPVAHDHAKHVYVSVGHQQMMTDALKPLGVSVFQLTAFGTMHAAGGRLFVDASAALATPHGRHALLKAMAEHDPLTEDAIRTLLERTPASGDGADYVPPVAPRPEAEPAWAQAVLDESRAEVDTLKRDIQGKSGPDLFDFIATDIGRLKKIVFSPRSMAVLTAAAHAASWLDTHMKDWLSEENVSYVLSQSVPDNVTAEMGLALLDVADAIRPYPGITSYLQRAADDGFLSGLDALEGGSTVRAAFERYLDKYGMRCTGEIDITRPRWGEAPTALVPALLANVRNVPAGEGPRKFEKGRREAEEMARSLLARLRQLPDGDEKAAATAREMDRLRCLTGYREYPKYAIVRRYFVYRQALLAEALRLVAAGVVRETEDIYYLTFQELREVSRTGAFDVRLVESRRVEHAHHQRLTPPRVMTSDGEVPVGRYRRANLPPDALVGLGVSSGVIEGRARIVLRMEEAMLEEGDILVTTFTDPSWTPLFVSIKGLVTEIGGLMTHGAVIAREYGLPAVVGVLNATQRIEDGRRIRVHGTHGYVELL